MKKQFLLTALLAIVSSITLLAQIPTNGLVGYWPFNGNANDASGNGNNGVVNGATLTNDRFGNPNNAYHFDGVSQFIEVANSPSLASNPNEITIAFWVKVESFPPGNFSDIIISKQSGSGVTQSGYNVNQGGNWLIALQTGAGGGNFGQATVPSNPNNYNQFHHVILIFKNDTSLGYIDGQFYTTYISNGVTIGSNSANLLFGKANWSNINAQLFNGILDDILIYNRALNVAEVNSLYSYSSCNGSPISTISTIGNTTFCQGSNVLLNVNESYSTYQWQRNNTNINGATNKTYTANAGGAYRCIVSNACGIDTSNIITLTSLPNVANKVLVTGTTTFCVGDSVVLNSSNVSSGYSYQWYRNNIAINGATSNTFIGKNPGTYKVVTKNNSNGCSRISSNNAIVAVTCRTTNREAFVGNVAPAKSILVYPNPNEGSFILEISDENIEDGVANFQVMNITGQIIFNGTSAISNGVLKEEIHLEKNFSKGLYLVKVQVNGSEMTEKVMLQ